MAATPNPTPRCKVHNVTDCGSGTPCTPCDDFIPRPLGRYYARPSAMDPDNSMDVFEQGRLNEFGGPYCVEVAVTLDQAARICREHNAAIAKAEGREAR